jgi:hypothetical protein
MKVTIHNHLPKRTRDARELSDSEFLNLAGQIGMALNNNRAKEDQLRRAGMEEEANKIYYASKEAAGKILSSSGISPRDFDKRLQKLGAGRRINVKMERLFGSR